MEIQQLDNLLDALKRFSASANTLSSMRFTPSEIEYIRGQLAQKGQQLLNEAVSYYQPVYGRFFSPN